MDGIKLWNSIFISIPLSRNRALTAKIQVDCMTKITTAWNPSKKRSNRNKLEQDCFRFSRHCLQPTGVTMQEHIPSPFRTNNTEALFQGEKEKIYPLPIIVIHNIY
jgi:hypothetical protein